MQTFNLPDLGEGLTEAELVTWHVAVGDTVMVDQPIAEVETAKSAVEVPCPFAGTVAELCGQPGETLLVGSPLIRVAPEGAQSYAEEELAGAKVPAAAEVERAGSESTASESAESGSGNVLIGYGTPGGAGATKRRRMPKNYRAAQPVVAEDTARPGRAPRVINPIVRRMAREHGVDVASLRGSGEDGLILRADVEAAIGGAARPAAHGAATVAAAPAPRATQATQSSGGVVPGAASAAAGERDAKTGLGIAERTPVRGVRKAIAEAMTRSRDEIPEATVWVDVDATALLELRNSLKNSSGGAPGLLALIGRFVLAGLAKYPELNSRIEQTGDGQEIVRFDGVNLGFAAQTDRGLVVPSVEHAETMSARQLDAELRELTAKAREGKCTPAELMRGTFTLNNYGVFGVDGSAAIINYPEVAILGVGRIIDKPWVVDGELTVRKVTVLTLAFDHRVCDGGAAGGFLRYIADAIENPGTVLADL